MVELVSKNFKGDERLRQCANDDAFNIRPRSKGDHVGKVQRALLGVQRPPNTKISDQELKDQFYGDDTVKAVLAFKSSFNPKILRAGQTVVDPIVGKQTIRRLDQLLKDQAKDDEVVVKTTDVVLQILGTDNKNLLGKPVPDSEGQLGLGVLPVTSFNTSVQTEEYLRLHNPLRHFQFFGGGGIDTMTNLVRSNADPKGVVVIIGMSVGGPTALQVGNNLSREPRIKINYVGICDGAFSNEQDSRRNLDVTADLRENFFQKQGDSIDPNQEFHGSIKNFTSFDFTNDPEFTAARAELELELRALQNPGARKQRFIFDIHNLAAAKGYRTAQGQMRNLLV